MMLAVVIKKSTLITLVTLVTISILIALFSISLFENNLQVFNNDEYLQMLNHAFDVRNKAMVNNAYKTMECLYDIQNAYGAWSYKYETKRIEYLNKWADKQGVEFAKIDSTIKITKMKEADSGYSFNIICSTEYRYNYKDDPDNTDLFRIVTYHYLIMTKKENKWLITNEWYLDPFEYSLNENNIKSESIKNYILSGKPRNFSSLSERRIQAVEYADRYCGASGDKKYGVMYNRKYNNYNGIGGDCTNFISQVLYEGGKFKKTSIWNYDGGGSSAWVRADSFKDYMLYSGRASLIAYGTYDKVLKASYKLEPGDLISYERKGRVEHTAVVTGADTRGYSLVNCHTVDSYRIPWDLGWNNKDVKFYLLRVHY